LPHNSKAPLNATKRRGRPVGSKNKPQEYPNPNQAGTALTRGGQLIPSCLGPAVSGHVNLDQISFDISFPPHILTDARIVNEYRGAMKAGAVFPPVLLGQVPCDERGYRIIDGWHRLAALRTAGFRETAAHVFMVFEDQYRAACLACNLTHGRRLSRHEREAYLVELHSLDAVQDMSARDLATHTNGTFSKSAINNWRKVNNWKGRGAAAEPERPSELPWPLACQTSLNVLPLREEGMARLMVAPVPEADTTPVIGALMWCIIKARMDEGTPREILAALDAHVEAHHLKGTVLDGVIELLMAAADMLWLARSTHALPSACGPQFRAEALKNECVVEARANLCLE